MKLKLEFKGKPLVSVIIAVYQGERFIRQSVESVLNQSYSNIELIIVNDGSTDKTNAILNDYTQLSIINLPKNSGVANARNSALKIAKGDLITFLDSDDIMFEKRIEWQVEQLRKSSDYDIVFGRQEILIDNSASKESQMFDFMMNKEKINLCSLMCPKEVFADVGNFDISLRSASDFEWFARAIAKGYNYEIMDRQLIKRRIHDTNITITSTNKKRLRLKILHEHIKRLNG